MKADKFFAELKRRNVLQNRLTGEVRLTIPMAYLEGVTV